MGTLIKDWLFFLAIITTACTVQVIVHQFFGNLGVLCCAIIWLALLLVFDPLIRKWLNK